MRKAIRAAVGHGHATIAVVCGAWHVPALDLTQHPVGADTSTLRGLPKVKVGVSWVPWTNARLAAATGYGAGVRSPGWYDHVFRHPARRAWPGSSSMPLACCAPPTCRHHPIT